MEYRYFPYELFPILHISLALMFIYCRCLSTVESYSYYKYYTARYQLL